MNSFHLSKLCSSAELCCGSFVIVVFFCPGDCGCFGDTILASGNPCGFVDSLCLRGEVDIYLNKYVSLVEARALTLGLGQSTIIMILIRG